MLYLASPFSHDDPEVREARYKAALAETALMLSSGHNVFSPICYSYQFERDCGLSDWAFWMRVDLDILSRCGEVHVLMLPGWDVSRGVKAEIEHARKIGKPIKLRKPEASNLTVGGCCP